MTDWFRNTTWNASVEQAFDDKLRRARRQEQYLRVQVCTLARSHPDVALKLLDRYFALPNDFDHAQAHVDRASATRGVPMYGSSGAEQAFSFVGTKP